MSKSDDADNADLFFGLLVLCGFIAPLVIVLWKWALA